MSEQFVLRHVFKLFKYVGSLWLFMWCKIQAFIFRENFILFRETFSYSEKMLLISEKHFHILERFFYI